MKFVIFGGFDYAVYWEMNQDTIWQEIEYFVDNDLNMIGTTYLGKPVYAPTKLLEEERGTFFVLIGSIVYHTELEFQLLDMGLKKDIDFSWAISPPTSFIEGGGIKKEVPLLWKRIEWKDHETNKKNLYMAEKSEFPKKRYEVAARLIDMEKVETVIDIGSANECFKDYLPETVNYYPVDYVKHSIDTILVDLNKEKLPRFDTEKSHTVIILIEVLQYVYDWKGLLKDCSEQCDVMVIGHNDFCRVNREYRRTSWTANAALFNHEIILEMQKNGFMMTDAYDFQLRDVIMRFEKG